MIVMLDLDDVIDNLSECWIAWLNNKYNDNKTIQDMTDWHISNIFPQLTHDQLYEPLDTDGFWETIGFIDGAIDGVHTLIEAGHEVYIVTSSYWTTLRDKITNIVFKHLPDIDWKHIIITGNKQLIGGDVLVDDRPANLENSNYISLLFSRPFNMSYECTEESGIIRVNDWEDLLDKIHTITMFKDFLNGKNPE